MKPVNDMWRSKIIAVRIMMNNVGSDLSIESWFALWDALLGKPYDEG